MSKESSKPTLDSGAYIMDVSAREKRIIRIFLMASPGMDAYMAAVERLCKTHNDAHSPMGDLLGITSSDHTPLLVPVDWRWVLESLDPKNSSLLLARLPVAPGDIFLGILGATLGPALGKTGLSAHRAMELAWEHWQRSTPGRHLIYRLDTPPGSGDRQQRQQIEHLFRQGADLDIFSRLSNPLSDRRGLRRRFANLEAFTQQLQLDLKTLLPQGPSRGSPQEGDQQVLVTLQLEVFGPQQSDVPYLADLTGRAAERFQANHQHPAAGLAQLSFVDASGPRRLIQAGLFLLAEMLRPRQVNGTQSALPAIRLVADAMENNSGATQPTASLQFRLNNLQHQPVLPGEFAISRNLLRLLPEALRTRFRRLDDTARGVHVWRFAAINTPPTPFRRLLGDLLRTLDSQDVITPQPLASHPHQSPAACYALLTELCQILQRASPAHRSAYHARWLVELENRLRRAVSRDRRAGQELPEPLANLRRLARLSGDQQTVAITRDTIDAMQMLCQADDIGAAPLLETLLNQHRPELLGFLKGKEMAPLRHRLAERLNGLADRLLLEELVGKRDNQSIAKLFELLGTTLPDSDLAAVANLLRGESQPTQAQEDDSPVRQRCELLIASEIRGGEPALPKPAVLWPLVAAPQIPLSTLRVIGTQLSLGSSSDNQKLFFDCGRARLDELTSGVAETEQLHALRQLLQGFFRQEHFLESGYLQRLEALLHQFLDRAPDFSVRTEPYERVLSLLHQARERRGKPRTLLPPVNGLALPVQQRLAGEWPYLELFITHPDVRVAGATRSNITAENVEQILFPEINKTVLSRLLRDSSLFQRPSAIVRALQHPNCDTEFARRQLPLLMSNPAYRQVVQRIATNPGSNPAVRQLVKLTLAQFSQQR